MSRAHHSFHVFVWILFPIIRALVSDFNGFLNECLSFLFKYGLTGFRSHLLCPIQQFMPLYLHNIFIFGCGQLIGLNKKITFIIQIKTP